MDQTTANGIWELLKIIAAFIFGGLGLEIYKRWSGKKRESLEVSKIYQEGQSLQIQVRANIDKLIDEKTTELNEQIVELKDTIIQISTKYKNDLDKYLDRMADLEKKFDYQLERNEQIEDKLRVEIQERQLCLEELAKLKHRVTDIEDKTS